MLVGLMEVIVEVLGGGQIRCAEEDEACEGKRLKGRRRVMERTQEKGRNEGEHPIERY